METIEMEYTLPLMYCLVNTFLSLITGTLFPYSFNFVKNPLAKFGGKHIVGILGSFNLKIYKNFHEPQFSDCKPRASFR